MDAISSLPDDFWLFSLLWNMASFAVVVAPAAYAIRYVKANPSLMAGQSLHCSIIRLCVQGQEDANSERSKADAADAAAAEEAETFAVKSAKLIFSAMGLQGSYLVWGALQERIMKHTYGEGDSAEQFGESQFLVFVNRVLAFCAAIAICRFTTQPKHQTPLYKYSFPSMSNVMSSWFQYEALKFVSFPTQVLAKACKVIPVMIMGKFVNGTEYPLWEYGCALGLGIGVAVFMFAKADDEGKMDEDDTTTSFSGLFLLVGYMAFDSFTSNYQSAVFKAYKPSKFQMMFGVNMFSCFFTLWSLMLRGKFFPSVAFMFRHSEFMWHVIVLSITSATGQIFIFHVIATYGPLVFTIIMTLRQVFSIFLSAMLFNHHFSGGAYVGIAIVAFSLFMKIYLKKAMK
jgi:adenosine 3'-phospho 5'-phosphosulfate transporter B2